MRHKFYDKFEEIAQLKDNWNGHGASSFDEVFVHWVEDLYKLVSDPDVEVEFFPTAKGSIQLEWENDEGSYLELECFPTGEVKAFVAFNVLREE